MEQTCNEVAEELIGNLSDFEVYRNHTDKHFDELKYRELAVAFDGNWSRPRHHWQRSVIRKHQSVGPDPVMGESL